MRSSRSLLAACALLLCSSAGAGAQVPAPQLDPAITAALAKISAAELRATDERLVAFGTRSTFSEGAGAKRGVFAARAYLLERFRAVARRSGGRMTVALDSYTQAADPKKRIPRDVVISSVVATLKGDDPTGRTYVMSSHYDSRNSNNDDGVHDAPGADDNGSATAAVVEAARVLAGVPLHATVIFACFDSEEQGLFGSAHFAKTLKDAHVDVQGDLNNDIVGASVGDDGVKRDDIVRIFSEALPPGTDPARVNVIGGENDSPSRELARFAKETGDAYPTGLHGMLVYRADRFLRGGDHESFNAEGFAAIRYVEPVENFNHQHQDVRVENGVQYGDLLQYVDFDYLAKVTRYNVASLATLALAPASPKVSVLTKALTNDTALTWNVVPRAVRYEILRRSTTDPTWTSVEDVGNVNATVLHFSKDNWLFGIRSVDAEGHLSVAAYPAPVRT
ncbi:MAG: peptidase m28 [Candidatus Eremiobacteraeota bacterium]|nr:peptidase m28 [Candidatus Eremiobacteraeota bacterium]